MSWKFTGMKQDQWQWSAEGRWVLVFPSEEGTMATAPSLPLPLLLPLPLPGLVGRTVPHVVVGLPNTFTDVFSSQLLSGKNMNLPRLLDVTQFPRKPFS